MISSKDTIKEKIQQRIDQKTKPIGALGMLEDIALQLAMLQSDKTICEKITLLKPTMLVFAADHGIAEQGVSIAPSTVTEQMVLNFINGGAAINCFCRINQIALHVVDAGIINEINLEENNAAEFLASQQTSTYFHQQRLGNGTCDISKEAAMSIEDVHRGLGLGANIVQQVIEQGSNIILLGEMGIANTSAASAIAASFLDGAVEDFVGFGTGISLTQYEKKIALINKSITRCNTEVRKDPYQILAELGGFEIVQMVGAVLAAAKAGITIVVDGFIVTVAVFAAFQIDPKIRKYLIFSHCSDEKAHQLLLNKLNAKPLLSLGLRLGEGTGAALAYPLIQAAATFYNDMATFEQAGVTV